MGQTTNSEVQLGVFTAKVPHRESFFVLDTFLQVLYDGKVMGKFCGSENSADGHHPGNQPILSPGNRLTVIFQTDNNNPERHQNVGFSAHYQALGNTSSLFTLPSLPSSPSRTVPHYNQSLCHHQT